MESTINFNDLPKTILQKIPLSIRTAKTIHNFNDLPVEVQYLLLNYKANLATEIDNSDTYDIKPNISVYNDFQPIISVKALVIEYLSNYLKVLTGSYPYDVTIGCGLKYHLQTKDTSLRNTLIFNELNLIISALSNRYNIAIQILTKDFVTIRYEDRTEVALNLSIKVDNEQFNVLIN